jgi:choline-phosphate cytidylyltransferase
MHRNEWVENADRWVAGFLEMFEEGCHKMVRQSVHNYMSRHLLYLLIYYFSILSHNLGIYQGTAIRDRIQERLRLSKESNYLLQNGNKDVDDDDDEEYYDDDNYEHYYDDEEYYGDGEDKKDEKEQK